MNHSVNNNNNSTTDNKDSITSNNNNDNDGCLLIFKDYHEKLLSRLTRDEINYFANLKSVEEKIVFLYKFKEAKAYPITGTVCNKDIETVRKLKEDGNKAFARKQYELALTLYSRCLLQYPENEDKVELSLVYANRSAALYYLNRYQLAISDANEAFEIGYPKELAYKLYYRKGKCLLALEEGKASKKMFKMALKCLDESNMSTSDKIKWQKDVHNSISSAVTCKINDLNKYEKSAIQNECYKQVGNISSSVTIKYSEKLGRYAEAVRDIATGELILCEQPYCAVLLQEYQYTHCFHCFKRITSYKMCPRCDKVIFCSIKCRRIAMNSHHAIECKILETIWNSGISITCCMAFRIITQNKMDYFLKLKKSENIRHDETSIIKKGKENKNSDTSKYYAIYNLVTHEARRRIPDVLHRMHLAIFLVRCLRFTNYFRQNEYGEILTEDEIFITKLIFHHLQVLQFNAHEVSELQIENRNVEQSRSVFLGGAIYPTLALFNHSCNPDIVRYFNGCTVTTRAIRPIKFGEMVCENYGPIFTQNSKQERRDMLLKQYWFNCECKACVQNWPSMDELCKTSEIPFKCGNKQCQNRIIVQNSTFQFIYRCDNCKTESNILKGLKTLQITDTKFSEAKECLRSRNIEIATRKFLDVLQVLNDNLLPPFKDYHLCQQMIRLCYLFYGNKYDI